MGLGWHRTCRLWGGLRLLGGTGRRGDKKMRTSWRRSCCSLGCEKISERSNASPGSKKMKSSPHTANFIGRPASRRKKRIVRTLLVRTKKKKSSAKTLPNPSLFSPRRKVSRCVTSHRLRETQVWTRKCAFNVPNMHGLHGECDHDAMWTHVL